MKVQRVRIPERGGTTWIVLGDDYLAIQPIQQFLSYLEDLERSPNTIRSYAHHLKLYWDYLQDSRLEWTAIGLSELAGFVSWLRNPQPGVISLQEQVAPRSESTINTILASVSAFYDYHERAEAVQGIPLYQQQTQLHRRYKGFLHHLTKGKPVRTRLIKLKVPQRIPSTLTQDQVKQLIDACQRLRDKFLVSLLYHTGMRVGQALGLLHQDIQSWDNLIQITPRSTNDNQARAKAREAYAVHVSSDLMVLYTDYLIQEFNETDSDYVFVNLWDGQIGAPMTYTSVADLFRRLSKKTGIAVHPHMLRHTHATELIRAGWDAALVQRRLGHAHVQTTINTYVHLTDDDLKSAYHAYLERR
jgi:integrase/recombinase XerD